MKFSYPVLLTALLAGCHPASRPQPARNVVPPPVVASPLAELLATPRLWNGELTLQGHPLPFQLEIRLESEKPVVYLIARGLSATEHLRCPGVAVVGDSLYIRLPTPEGDELLVQRGPEEFRMGFNDKGLVLGAAGSDQWRGAWVDYSAHWRVPLSLELGGVENDTDSQVDHNALGLWYITLGQASQAHAGTAVFALGSTFDYPVATVRGALLTELGSFAMLSGWLDKAGSLVLSSFDGNRAQLLALPCVNEQVYHTDPEGNDQVPHNFAPDTITGTFYDGRTAHFTFTATREPSAAALPGYLPNAQRQ